MNKKPSSLGMLLGKNIAEQRNIAGLTQAELAEKLGLDSVSISRFERGSNLPSLLRCEQIAEALNTSFVKLFSQSSAFHEDQAAYVDELLAGLDSSNRAFMIEMIKAWSSHLKGVK